MFTDIAIQKISFLLSRVPLPELKEIFFIPQESTSPEKAMYALFGDVCVFSGITNFYGGTSGWPETFINLIACREKRDPTGMIFCDLQTFAGGMQNMRGHFSFFRLEFKQEEDGSLHVYDWIPEGCPPEAREVFEDCIGVTEDQRH